MNDPESVNRLLREAFLRSQKDVHIAHIFISLRDDQGTINEDFAVKKRDAILQRLKTEDFMKVAASLPDDPQYHGINGDLGYITVFSLPYELENAVYATPVGRISPAIHSKIGYHIFKVLDQRKAFGKIKAQQILLAIPPNADDAMKERIASKADSLYKRIMAGDNFNDLATAFSNDYVTAATGGMMMEAGIGTYDQAFEKVLWSLPKDGAVSKPFQTSHGWHIVKRISIRPVITDSNNRAYMSELQSKMQSDSRWKSSKDFIYNTLRRSGRFKRFPYDDQAMWAMTDSMLDHQPMKEIGRSIKANTPIFQVGDSIVTASAWISYANAFRYKPDGSGAKMHSLVRDEFEQAAMYNYYKEHLEEYNREFRDQMLEFKDGNMFFEIMQQEIWNKAQTDTASLHALYEKNKKDYLWKQSVDAVMFFCSDENTAKTVYDEISKNPKAWRSVTDKYSDKVVADSSRYEWDQIPNLSKTTPKAGMITMPLLNQSDNSSSFAYIIRSYNQPMQRSFAEAKGMLINDYQVILDNQWIESLRKKYPVKIDQKVLADISK
jgi:peptidyl-prolyl cis-trans isomerase SurA